MYLTWGKWVWEAEKPASSGARKRDSRGNWGRKSEVAVRGRKGTLGPFGFKEQGWEESQPCLLHSLNQEEEKELPVVAVWPSGKCAHLCSRCDEFSLEPLSVEPLSHFKLIT